MTESQFRNLLNHKRDRLSHLVTTKHILPCVDTIFENKDIMKKINLMKATLLTVKAKKLTLEEMKIVKK